MVVLDDHQSTPGEECETAATQLLDEYTGPNDDQYHSFPANPSAWDYVLYFPLSVIKYFRRLSSAFGTKFVVFTILVYGIQQGTGEVWLEIASYWYLLDSPPKGLGLSNTMYTTLQMACNTPWQVKSIYGMISDLFPFRGLHRSPYIAFAGTVGVLSFLTLSLVPTKHFVVFVALFVANLSIAMPDVMIDAAIAERCRAQPRLTTDLQTLCWSSLFFFFMVMSAAGGFLQGALGSRALYGLTAATALVVVYPALAGWLRERIEQGGSGDDDVETKENTTALRHIKINGIRLTLRDSAATPEEAWGDKLTFVQSLRHPLRGPIFKLAIFVAAILLFMGMVGEMVENEIHVSALGILVTIAVCCAVWHFERKISEPLAKATLYIVLQGALQPTTSVLSVWQKETNGPDLVECGDAAAEEGSDAYAAYSEYWCHQCAEGREYLEGGFPRPCFDSPFLGMATSIKYFFALGGTCMYNKYFADWSYRKIWTVTQVLLVVVNLVDLVWVLRLNLMVGLPDAVFILGEEALTTVVQRLNTMPLFTLMASLCPPGLEATLFALSMGLSNYSSAAGMYLGVGLVRVLGTFKPAFPNLAALVLIRSLTRVLPLFLLPFLAPRGAPNDSAWHDIARSTKPCPQSMGQPEAQSANRIELQPMLSAESVT